MLLHEELIEALTQVAMMEIELKLLLKMAENKENKSC
jgi:hypothetical protein